MNLQPEDQKVIDLLTKLKEANGGYPSSMLTARREMFMKQAANVGLGLGAGTVLKDAAKGNGAGASTTVTSKILEITLIAALAVEAGTVAFLYRDQITATVLGFLEPTPIVTTQPDLNITIPETIGDLETPLVTSTASETLTTTPSGTPEPVFAQEETPSNNGSNSDGGPDNNSTHINANATPNPNENQGNHYGLTPRPDRTKENQGGGNGGNPNNDGNNNNNNGNNNR